MAFCMGIPFPTGLQFVSDRHGTLVPWAWAVNGCTSVVATVGAAVLAMSVGFSRVAVVAVACYALAGLLALRLPAEAEAH